MCSAALTFQTLAEPVFVGECVAPIVDEDVEWWRDGLGPLPVPSLHRLTRPLLTLCAELEGAAQVQAGDENHDRVHDLQESHEG